MHLRAFRSWRQLDLCLETGLVLVVGPNGVGKTNLLEGIHVGTQGFSPRARSDATLVHFAADAARVSVRGRTAAAPFESDVTLRRSGSRHVRLNGVRLASSEELRRSARTLVFTPDRLAIVKGAPATRRAFLDRAAERLYPGRAGAAATYTAVLAQRNAALRRAASGLSSERALEPWTEKLAEAGRELVALRRATVAEVAPAFADCAARLGLPEAELEYEGDAPTVEELERRLPSDLERGMTSAGPHLHDLGIKSAGRPLRTFGSQGEQRIAVLALVLGEARALAARPLGPPLVLLDDVLSELDEERRRALVELVAGEGQTIVTATARELLPGQPRQTVTVGSDRRVR